MFFKILSKFKKKHLPNKGIFPDTQLKKIWDFFMLSLTFFNFFLFSFEISFFLLKVVGSSDQVKVYLSDYPSVSWIKSINVIAYFVDIIFCFCTGYHDVGKIIIELKLIKSNYLKNLFVYDFLAYIPTLIFFMNRDALEKVYYFNFLFFFIYMKFSQRMKDLQEFIIQEKEEWEDYFLISILYLRTIFISHIIACVWFFLGQYNNGKSWMNTYGLGEAEW